MKVVKLNNNDANNKIRLIEGTNSVVISSDEIGNVSFTFYSLGSGGNVKIFPISRDDSQVYKAFENLYFSLKNCEVFQVSEKEKDTCLTKDEIIELEDRASARNRVLRDSFLYPCLVSGDTITWYSDDSNNPMDALMIRADEDKFYLEFSSPDVFLSSYTVKMNAVNDKCYNPFHVPFLRLYQELNDYDPNFNQVHMDEYVKKLEMKNS